MRRHLIALIVTTLVSFSTTTFSGVAVKEVREMGIDEVIELLSHPDWKERDMAISYGIKRFTKDERVKIALIKLLEHENNISKKWCEEYEKNKNIKFLNEEYGFGHGEYYLDVVASVISINDERAMSVLIDALGCGNKIINAVADFGKMTVKPLIEKFKSDDIYYRQKRGSILIALNKIIYKDKTVLSKYRDNIKKVLIIGLNDATMFTRREAVRTAELLSDDSEILAILKKLSLNDKGKIKNSYPVREEAQKVLEKLGK